MTKTTWVRDATSGQAYYLETDEPIGGGGEAKVYQVQGHPGLLAKVYKDHIDDMRGKLSFMLANPPENPTASRNHQAYAWPSVLICAGDHDKVVGFLMPRVNGMREVFEFYNPAQRRQTCALFDYRYLMQTARNIAGIMSELHSKGYVIGDVNQRNFFVSDSAMVTVIDTDSFQFRDKQSGQLFLCRVRSVGFIAPEAYKKGLKYVERTVEEDLFGLAVLTFHLLMEGVHPFACRYKGPDEPPPLDKNVMDGNFPHKRADSRFEPPPTAPPFEILSPELRALFMRSFIDGHGTPTARPTAKEWQRALSKASKELVTCVRVPSHFFPAHLGQACPWCARVERGFADSFPSLVSPPSPAPARKPVPRKRWTSVLVPVRQKRWIFFLLGVFLLWLLGFLFSY